MAQAQAYEHIKVERDGPLTIVTINRPNVYNALHRAGHFEMHDVFDKFAADPDQWIAIVTGAGGKGLVAGNDLKHQAAGGEQLGRDAARILFEEQLQHLRRRRILL